MIHLLTEVLDIPFRERNLLLLAAGFAPAYREASPELDREELAPVRSASDAILAQQEPFPAVVLNRQWDVLLTNAAADRFVSFLLGGPASRDGVPNLLRLMFAPDGLRPWVKNWEETAEALMRRVHRETVGGLLGEPTQQILEEILQFPGVPANWRRPKPGEWAPPVLPVTFEKADLTFNFFSTVTTLGTPQDVLLQEIRIECFFPLDSRTREHAAGLLA